MPFRLIQRLFGVVLLLGLAACGTGQRNVTLDAAPAEVGQIRNIAIASVTARPSETRELVGLQQGNLVRVLTKFENEIFQYLLNRGFNVVDPAISRVGYSRDTDYEDLYIGNSPEMLTNINTGSEFKFIANNMKKLSTAHAQKPSIKLTSEDYEPSQYNLMPGLNRTSSANPYMTDIMSSANTRLFSQLEFGNNLSTPSMTVLGGADDSRWSNSASRRAVGELTRRMGADAYLVVDTHLSLSPRNEGTLVAGILGGGTRNVICEGTAMLVRNDGTIISVESFHGFSNDHISGSESSKRPRVFSGAARMEGNNENLNEMTMQAIRVSADMIADTLQGYVRKYGPDSGNRSFLGIF